MLEKVNCWVILKDHFLTLKDYGKPRISIADILLFFLVPLFVSILGYMLIPVINKDLVIALVTAFSVFAALLFNLLLLIFDIIRRSKGEGGSLIIKFELLKDIYANISYNIFISITAIILLLIPLLNIDIPNLSLTGGHSDRVISFIIYFLVGNFVLTLYMILKRVHILLSGEFEPAETQNP